MDVEANDGCSKPKTVCTAKVPVDSVGIVISSAIAPFAGGDRYVIPGICTRYSYLQSARRFEIFCVCSCLV